jgi:hypothetical protein
VPRKLFTKGNKAAANRGPNKISKSVKETVLQVFLELQNDPNVNLKEWAKKRPTDFYQIAAKLIPTEVKANVDANVKVKQVTGMIVK